MSPPAYPPLDDAEHVRLFLDGVITERELDADPPEKLYHYTSLPAAHSILQSGSIFATHYACMNDPSEGRVLDTFLPKVQALLRARFQATPMRRMGLLNAWPDIKDELISLTKGRAPSLGPYAPYITSFTESRDHLGQWRLYGDAGRGVALGLHYERLVASIQAPNSQSVRFVRASYNPALHLDLAEVLVDFMSDFAEAKLEAATSPKESIAALAWAADTLRYLLLMVGAMMKHTAYSDENEWRAIVLGPELRLWTARRGATVTAKQRADAVAAGIETRAAGNRIVPYFRLNLADGAGRLPIEELHGAPCTDVDSLGILGFILNQRSSGSRPTVLRSSIPYRVFA